MRIGHHRAALIARHEQVNPGVHAGCRQHLHDPALVRGGDDGAVLWRDDKRVPREAKAPLGQPVQEVGLFQVDDAAQHTAHTPLAVTHWNRQHHEGVLRPGVDHGGANERCTLHRPFEIVGVCHIASHALRTLWRLSQDVPLGIDTDQALVEQVLCQRVSLQLTQHLGKPLTVRSVLKQQCQRLKRLDAQRNRVVHIRSDQRDLGLLLLGQQALEILAQRLPRHQQHHHQAQQRAEQREDRDAGSE